MDNITKELSSRKEVIQKEVETFFNNNMQITDWDVPEADDRKAAIILMDIIEDKLSLIRNDIENGKYDYY